MTDTPRREFLGSLAVSGAALALAACATNPASQSAPVPKTAPLPPAGPVSADGPWDNAWLDRLSSGGRYKQFFDAGAYQEGGALFYAKNYLNGIRDWFGFEHPDVQVVLGLHGDAWPIVLNDALWAKFELGKEKKTHDPRTKEFATRNVFWQPKQGEPYAEYGVDVLQQRGGIFLLCNNVLRFVTRSLAGKTGTTYEVMRKELIAGLLPGVTVVPAMVAACGLAQSRGCSYVYAGG
jgi:hypothetical protein